LKTTSFACAGKRPFIKAKCRFGCGRHPRGSAICSC
jgi:hypothetical protein